MTRAQYLILCRARRRLSKVRRRERGLRKMCEDPEKQWAWDDWQNTAGLESGLSAGLAWLEEFIRLGKEPKK